MSNHSRKPGSWATILRGPREGLTGKVVDYFYEKEKDGTPVPGGLAGCVLAVAIEGVPGKLAFWSDEIRIHR